MEPPHGGRFSIRLYFLIHEVLHGHNIGILGAVCWLDTDGFYFYFFKLITQLHNVGTPGFDFWLDTYGF